MRSISFGVIKEKVKKACIEANYILGEDVLEAFHRARAEEDSPLGKILNQLKRSRIIPKGDRRHGKGRRHPVTDCRLCQGNTCDRRG